ncbi:MAG: alpha-galactosidase [Pirellulales bacterium]|nr:alpha-galactosidase [Pirellulales bacterium]
MTCGWGDAKRDRNVNGQPLAVRGRAFNRGIGTHAPSKLRLRLDKNAQRFTGQIGVDDSAEGRGRVRFQIFADGKQLWDSGPATGTSPPLPFDVDLRGVDILELRVDDGEDGASYDHADWLEPKLILVPDGTPPASIEPYESIAVGSSGMAIHFMVGDDGRLYQAPIGVAPVDGQPPRFDEAYPQGGDGYVFEPALLIVHADGNRSTSLQYAEVERRREDDGAETTRIELRDEVFPFQVSLCFRTDDRTGVIEQWTEISHEESGPVILERMASASLLLPAGETNLLHFYGNWNDEMNPHVDRLTPGMKVLDSKLGVRAHQFTPPSFVVGLDGSLHENKGRVLAGSLAWSGSFQAAFDHTGQRIRALCGVNPYASQYRLPPREIYTTPTMIWAWGESGLGDMSRRLHRWARRRGVRDGDQPRETLLNNWEATGFDFDENRLVSLFPPAKELGLELFLLDDGWFGNAHPRLADNAGLGDWAPNRMRFPRGMAPVAEAAREQGLRFGIWIEPEMVNPRSQLFERHPDWVIRQPQRELELQRNQLVLDLTRPEVQEFAWDAIQQTLSVPGVSYAKWDANRYVTQPGSPWLPADRQSHLWIDYTRALYDLMAKTAERFPETELMLCSGGGGRVDYGALKYFHEFWPSDSTDAVRRVAMQWDYSYFFPAIATCSHVTRAGERPLHFATAVAMSARFGMDVDLAKVTVEEKAICRQAIAAYKRLRDVVHLGDLYRIESPHEGDRSVISYVDDDRSRAVVFVYKLQQGAPRPVVLQGLDPARDYLVQDAHPAPGRAPLPAAGKLLSGAKLMADGLDLAAADAVTATVVELRSAVAQE